MTHGNSILHTSSRWNRLIRYALGFAAFTLAIIAALPAARAVDPIVSPLERRAPVPWQPASIMRPLGQPRHLPLGLERVPQPRRVLPITALPGYRVPGEFEFQRALMLGCCELVPIVPEVFTELVKESLGKVEILALVSDVEQYEQARNLIKERGIPAPHLRFLEVPHDTMWARDYGPIVIKSDRGRPALVDADYDFGRANDDQVPQRLAEHLKLGLVRLPIRLDGGNFLSNGAGVALTTFRLIDENVELPYSERELHEILQGTFNLQELVMLEPLLGESTGHVDMFAAFVSEQTVVVGQYDPLQDPDNAAILDRNAERLSQVRTRKGNLRVVRIPMPGNHGGVWRTYTNVVFANGVLFVPTYGPEEDLSRKRAFAAYRRLLPTWRIVPVDSRRVIESAGALHCVTMNLGPVDRLRQFPTPTRKPVFQPPEIEFPADIPRPWPSDQLGTTPQRLPVLGAVRATPLVPTP